MKASRHVSGDFVKGSDEIYRCTALQEFSWLAHGFTTRRSSESGPPLTTLRQIHSAKVWNAAGLNDRELEGDALVSNEERKWVGVRTADCVPILLAGVRPRAVGAIHAGWRGTAEAIARRAVERLNSEFGADPDEIFAAIGPSIGVCCYQVGPEVRSRFEDLFPEWDSVSGPEEPGMLNLSEANRRILHSAGVPDSQIFSSNLCTSHRSDDFFSYRREPSHPGRMISFIARLS